MVVEPMVWSMVSGKPAASAAVEVMLLVLAAGEAQPAVARSTRPAAAAVSCRVMRMFTGMPSKDYGGCGALGKAYLCLP